MNIRILGNFCKSSIALTIAAISSTTLPVQAALLVSSRGDNSIKQYDEITGTYIRDFVTAGSGGLLNPQGLTLGTDGNLFVSSFGTNSVKEYSGTTGEYIGDFASSSSGLLRPEGLTLGTDGSLFVVSNRIPGTEVGMPGAEQRRSGVLQYDTITGELLNTISTGSVGLPSGPQPVDVVIGGPDSTLFVSSSSARFNPGSVSEYDPTTGAGIGRNYTISDPSALIGSSPKGLAINDNFLFYTESSSVGRYDLVNRIIDPLFVDRNSGGLSQGVDVAIGGNGNLFVSDSGTNSIKQYDGGTGDFLGDFITSGSGGLSSPSYLTTANVPVPEPSSVLGIAALGGLFVGGALQRRVNSRKKPSI
ncbi:MAG: PEP-CTERM sorting domain-containing protein [Tatlockia sp.]|nr:PEP-CTERM sorting domain-containing protein [Tatlockia sp.]